VGNIGRLPFKQAGIAPSGLGRFLQDFLPDALSSSLQLNLEVEWGSGPHRSGALIPFWLVIDTGYGTYRKAAAVTSDGELLVLGNSFPRDQDPVAYRRALLSSDDHVMWDVHAEGDTAVEIVEFSDLECPACRGKWPVIKRALESIGGIRHGMVSFPLTTIHPWAFRSACATWCVARQDAELVVPFKELFYDLQREMEVSLVTPTSLDFVAGNGLDDERFRGCYLRAPSLDAVHSQLELGHQLGVIATPTYFVNGWKVQVPGEDWFGDFVLRLAAGDDPP
jgi:protein-disulfide isomerase